MKTDKVLKFIGKVSGFVFQASGEPTVYWVGDSIWCEPVKIRSKSFSPILSSRIQAAQKFQATNILLWMPSRPLLR